MEKICGQNSTLAVLENGHIGSCFLQTCLICPIHALLAATSIFYYARFSNTQNYVQFPRFLNLNIWFSVIFVLATITQIICSAVGLQTVHPPSYYLSLSFIAFSWFLTVLQFLQKARPTFLLCAMLILSLGTTVAQLSLVIIRLKQESDMNNVKYRVENYGVILRLFFQTFVVTVVVILQMKWSPALMHIRLYSGIQAEQTSETDRLLNSEDYGVYYSGVSHSQATQELTTVDENSNCFSCLTFWWVYRLMKKGLLGKIQAPEDVFVLPPSLWTKRIRESFQETLDSLVQTGNTVNRHRFLLKALHKSFGLRYYSIGVLKLLGDALGFASPLLLHALVSFMENRNEPIQHGYYYASGLFISNLVGSFISCHYSYQVNKIGLQIKAAVITAVYHKTLSVKSVGLHSFSTGEVVNFMSSDTVRIANFCTCFHQFWSLPFQIAISLYLLQQQVGLSFLAGLCFAILLIPVNKWLAAKLRKYSEAMMEKKDSRVKVMNEILYGIRVIKFYAWEKMFSAKVDSLRDGELKNLKGMKYVDAWCVYFWATTPVLISILTFCTYVLLGNTLTAAKVFTSIALFNMLIFPLNAFPWVISGLIEAWVSLKRVNKFLVLEDLDLDKYYTTTQYFDSKLNPSDSKPVISVKNGQFTWNESGGNSPSDAARDNMGQVGTLENHGDQEDLGGNNAIVQQTQGLQDINLSVYKGQFIGVIGKVGSGKTSLLAAITGEMNRTEGEVYVTDLRNGSGLAAQESWIQHASVRDNILFGKPFEYNKYQAVIKACALEEDFKILPNNDQTEIGENGVTLSGGQKSRIALARAVYQDKDIYLLDDPLAAVDRHVAAHIFTNCVMGVLKNKTRILCTHHRKYLKDADVIVVMDAGRIMCFGPPHVILEKDVIVKHIASVDEKAEESNINEESAEETVDTDTRLVEEEKKDVGVVKYHVYRSYYQAAGSCLAVSILLSLFLMQSSRNISDWWLSYWISHAKDNQSSHSNISFGPTSFYTTSRPPTDSLQSGLGLHIKKNTLTFYLVVYGGIAVANSIFTFFRAFLFAYGGLKAAQVVHRKLLSSILQAPISFFDATPIGRIINRFSSDTYSIDDSLPFIMNIFMAQLFGVVGTIVVTCYGLPWFTLVLIPLGFLYYKIQNYYRKTSREVKRLMTVSLSPLYAHFSETLTGLATIRALRATQRFSSENERKLELNQRANFSGMAASQWLGFQLQMLGVVMITCVSFIAVLEHHFSSVDPGLVGLAISYALTITSLLSGLVSSFTETEKQMVSVERAMQYVDGVPREEQGEAVPSNPWPSHGRISFNKVALIYRPGLPPALRDVSFEIAPAEKIGIVGRTGSGKSSLLLVLFKMVKISSGAVTIDGVNIAALNLQKLRSSLSIIPQDPFLFSDSVRKNLDPTDKFDDHQLWEVLKRCYLRDAVENLGGLSADVGERGRNLSCGQRQLLCLARALLKHAKILCIDEATASVDFETDQLIQKTIREEFQASTVLTIAHRIETILDSDRVLVMDKGRVAEFGSPGELQKDDQSLFSKLVQND